MQPNGTPFITASETVVLAAPEFAPAAKLVNTWQPLTEGPKVSGPELARSLVAAAILELEQAGSVRLKTGKRKVTFGLREMETVFLVPNGATAAWPQGSFESRLLQAARQGQEKSRNYVEMIVYEVLGRDSSLPWWDVLAMAQQALTERGLLEKAAKEKLFGIGLPHYALPAGAAAQLGTAVSGRVQALLDGCRTGRPQVWEMLAHEIKKAFDKRSEGPDAD